MSNSNNNNAHLVTFTTCITWFIAGIASGIVAVTVANRLGGKNRESKQEEQNESFPELPAPRRYGAVIKLKPEKYLRYRELHDNVWLAVLQRMYDSNIRNFTIYYHKETNLLFQHYEWIGHFKGLSELEVFENDMNAIGNDPITRQWWKECEPCQESLSEHFKDPRKSKPSNGGSGQWWIPLECVTHCGFWPTQFSTLPKDPDFVKIK
jgi:L-rhamnose mutarotase